MPGHALHINVEARERSTSETRNVVVLAVSFVQSCCGCGSVIVLVGWLLH